MRRRYQTPMPWNWFVQRPGYRRFMAREATSVLIAGYLVYLLVWLARAGQGPEAWTALVAAGRTPLSVVLHLVVLAGALYHSITWFNLTPKIMPLYLGEDRVPDTLAAVVLGYAPWLVVSGIVLWGALR